MQKPPWRKLFGPFILWDVSPKTCKPLRASGFEKGSENFVMGLMHKLVHLQKSCLLPHAGGLHAWNNIFFCVQFTKSQRRIHFGQRGGGANQKMGRLPPDQNPASVPGMKREQNVRSYFLLNKCVLCTINASQTIFSTSRSNTRKSTNFSCPCLHLSWQQTIQAWCFNRWVSCLFVEIFFLSLFIFFSHRDILLHCLSSHGTAVNSACAMWQN